MGLASGILGRLGLGAPRIVAQVQKEALTYLEPEALEDLYRLIQQIEQQGTEGCLLECGCALGGSAIVMAAAKSPQRPFYVYDVFGMIPPPSDKDGKDVLDRYGVISSGQAQGIKGNKYYGYEEDLQEKVVQNFTRHGFPPREHNVHLVKGLFQDTLHVEKPVALAHVDGDWYESVSVCVERIAPRLVKGGAIVIDDYDHWSGCQRAVDDFLKGKSADFELVRKARPHLVRK